MEEVETIAQSQEIATPQIESHEEAPVQETQSLTPPIRDEDKQEKNWRELNRAKKDLERELKLQREMNEKIMAMIPQSTQKTPDVDELDAIGDEEFLPKGKNKKLVAKEMKPLLQKVEELEKQLEQQKQFQFMDQLKRQYSDFQEVVNSETLAILEQQEPELAALIVESKDPYKIGMQSYKYIKALNIVDKSNEVRRVKEVDKKLEKNAKTVQTPQAYDKRPLAQAYKMTDADKKMLYEEMHNAASKVGFSY